MKFSFCSKCCDVTGSKLSLKFVVVQPIPRVVIQEFDNFYQAREFAAKNSPSARVEEHSLAVCFFCGTEK